MHFVFEFVPILSCWVISLNRRSFFFLFLKKTFKWTVWKKKLLGKKGCRYVRCGSYFQPHLNEKYFKLYFSILYKYFSPKMILITSVLQPNSLEQKWWIKRNSGKSDCQASSQIINFLSRAPVFDLEDL